METISVNGKEFEIVKLLGKGKGGYSYLAKREGKEYVLKQIHHEPCSYYTFGNKIQSEINDEIFYIDYECNDYMEEWNFETWGIKYWSKTPEFMQYVKEHG